MSFSYLKKLPTPSEIKEQYPLPQTLAALKKERDQMISDVITGKDSRFLVIIGPCSADNEDAVLDYVSRLAPVAEKVKDRLIIIPRIYTNKPRTTGEGYKGIASQPDPEKKPDMLAGLTAMRSMHIHAIEACGLTCADEMLCTSSTSSQKRFPNRMQGGEHERGHKDYFYRRCPVRCRNVEETGTVLRCPNRKL